MECYIFQSSRLGFRLWRDEDQIPFARMGRDPAVMQYFPSLLDSQQSAEMVQRIDRHFKEKGYGLYAVDRLDDGQFIGFIGFSTPRFEAHFTPCTEIGWRLQKDAWGQGFATEGARRCLQYGFEQLGLTSVVSFTATINHRSIRVMEKAGMTYAGIFEHPLLKDGDPLKEHVLYKTGFPA